MEQKSNKRTWRKLVKKLQRKRRRQKQAQQRDKELEEAELEKLKDPLYKSWLEQQDSLQKEQELAEENERQQQEEQWLRRELLAQQQFRKDALKKQAEENKIEADRLKQEEQLKQQEEQRRRKQEQIKLQAELAAKEFEDVMICMHNYLENSTMATPKSLNYCVETRPGEKSCDFFDKTNCCRFGATCSYNHKRPLLSKILLLKHFFQHPLLEQQDQQEYAKCDSELELSERDLRDAYDEFCEDVWPVLEEFGCIVNFRAVRNVYSHLRGHVFVEYEEKRSSLKAFINLQNRYYASKRINIEFSNLRNWHSGICGMHLFIEGLSLDRKCPKGVKCNFLHLMQNIDNKYNEPIEKPDRSKRRGNQNIRSERGTPLISWNAEDSHKNSRNWRWSESPEIELKCSQIKENYNGNNKSRSGSTDSPKPSSTSTRSRSPKRRHDSTSKRSTPKSPISRSHTKSRRSPSHSRHHHKNDRKSSSRDKRKSYKHKDKSPDSKHHKH